MPDFKTKMYQIRFRLGIRPRPRWGAYMGRKGVERIRRGGREGSQGLIQTPMSKILKNSLIAELI